MVNGGFEFSGNNRAGAAGAVANQAVGMARHLGERSTEEGVRYD
jgi:hypothetical protein